MVVVVSSKWSVVVVVVLLVIAVVVLLWWSKGIAVNVLVVIKTKPDAMAYRGKVKNKCSVREVAPHEARHHGTV